MDDNTKPVVASPKKILIRGAAWSVGTRWAVKGVGFINTVVMARLLLPEDYGIVAMAFLIVALIQAMVDFGAGAALMRKNEVTRDEIDSAWTLRLMQNLGVAILLISVSPLASRYFEEPRVLYVLLIFSVCVAMSGLTNIGLVLAQKEFNFSLDFRVQVIYKTVSVFATIVAGYFLRDYRALVVGVVAGYSSGFVLSYALHPYRPRWNTSKIGEIWAVTKWLMVAGVGGFILRKGDELIAGRVGTTSEFGQYNVGSDLGQLPTGEVGPAMLKALLPVLVAIRGGQEEIKAAVIKTMSAVNTITLPIGFGFAALAAPATAVILGPSWSAAAQYVAAFSVAGALQVIQSPLNTLLLVRGHTKIQSQVVWIEFAAFILMALILTPQYHLIGLVWARIASLTVNLILTVIASKYYNKISFISVLSTIARPLIGSVFMFFLVEYLIQQFDGDILKLISGILCGIAFFSVWTVSTWLLFGKQQGLESTVRDYIKKNLNFIR